MDTIKLLEELHIPTTNRIRAVHAAGELAFDPIKYREIVKELTGKDTAVNDDEVKFTFLYLVQDIASGLPADLNSAEDKAIRYVHNNPWVLVKPDYEYTPKSTVDALGNPKQKKGEKKRKAIEFWNANQNKYSTRKQWIDALCEHVGLTKAAASTYHYNLKTSWK